MQNRINNEVTEDFLVEIIKKTVLLKTSLNDKLAEIYKVVRFVEAFFNSGILIPNRKI